MEQDANSQCASSFCAHRVSESLMAENCSGGSGPSSSETHQTMFLFKDLKLIDIIYTEFYPYLYRDDGC